MCVCVYAYVSYSIIITFFFHPLEDDAEVQERDQLRYDRHKERERERRLARAHPERRSARLLIAHA